MNTGKPTDGRQQGTTVELGDIDGQTLPSGKTAIILVLILLGSLAVRFLCFAGVESSDSIGYVQAAGNAATGKYPWRGYPAVYSRIGFVLPLAPLVGYWGYGLRTPALYNLACSLGLVVLTFSIGRTLFSRQAGLWAAAVIAASTLAVVNGTSVLPDTPQAFFCALSIALALAAGRGPGRPGVGVFCVAAGAALGVAWLCKCTSVFVTPALLLIVLGMRHRKGLASACGIAGFGLVLLLEMAFWAAVSGHPLERFHILFGSGSASASGRIYAEQSLWEYPTKMFVIVSDDGLFYYLLVAAVIWSLLRARGRAAVALIWLASYFLISQFGAVSFSPYRSFWHQPRYLMTLVPAGAVLAGAWLCTIARRHPRIATVLYLLYAAPCLLLAYVSPVQTHTPAVAAKTAVDIFRRIQPPEVYTDRAFAQLIDYFGRNDTRQLPPVRPWLTEDLEPAVDVAARPGALVVRFDGTLRRAIAGQAKGLTADQIHAGIEAVASKERVPVRYGGPQRAVMGWMWSLLRKAPLPEGVSRRLKSAFSRHLAEPVLIIYRIAQPGYVPASSPNDGAASTRPTGNAAKT